MYQTRAEHRDGTWPLCRSRHRRDLVQGNLQLPRYKLGALPLSYRPVSGKLSVFDLKVNPAAAGSTPV